MTKEILGLPPDETLVPDDVLSLYCGRPGPATCEAWEKRLAVRGDREAYEACIGRRGIPGWEAALPTWQPGESLATSSRRGRIEALADKVPGLVAAVWT